jgi:hypothetical protein
VVVVVVAHGWEASAGVEDVKPTFSRNATACGGR